MQNQKKPAINLDGIPDRPQKQKEQKPPPPPPKPDPKAVAKQFYDERYKNPFKSKKSPLYWIESEVKKS
jgi:hypothetical protein